MDKHLRFQYLQALGIDVWAPRHKLGSGLVATQIVMDSQSAAADLKPQQEPVAETDLWHELEIEVRQCHNCLLSQTRTNTVFGSGNRKAQLMLIGEAPGESEDRQGLPFVGKAGQLLTEMIRAIGLQREEVFICNILKCRPPNNRDPNAEEVQACSNFLQRQIALIQPKMILAVGRIAAQQLLNTDAPLSALRGKVHDFLSTPVVVIYHPAYLLRSPSEKRKAWDDLQIAMQNLYDLKTA